VIGHVDAGKSTLMGHLLFQLGQVSNKQMHKYKQESQKIGKSSFAFAWVLDETEEERARGVTIDLANYKFETEKKMIYLMDAPGHKDFIPNMITGAAQADCAILVINSITGEFESGFESGGQTQEHSLLAKSLGVQQIVIAVNKMDMCDWSQNRFNEICARLSKFLIKQVGFKENDIFFVPCSGLIGENLSTKSTNEKLTKWYNENLKETNVQGGFTLIDAINRLRPIEKPIDKPLRICISDVFRSPQTAAISIAGKIEAGTIKCGDKICVLPANETGVVKTITIDDLSYQMSFAGDSVVLNVSNVDINNISIGNFICDCTSPPSPISNRLKARIVLFNLEPPFVKGFSVVFHYKSLNEAATIKKLVAQLDKTTGEVIKEKPRFLTNGMSAIVEIELSRPICMELYQNYKELGRFMLRYAGKTIAAGQIIEVNLISH
jgi:elongation factor 1 alpha-like protein